MKRPVDRGVLKSNKFHGTDMASSGKKHLMFNESHFNKAKIIALLKSDTLKTDPQIIEFILSDYVSMHDLKLTERLAGSK